MRVLWVLSGNSKYHKNIPAFISSQAKSLVEIGLEIDFYFIHGRGVAGYLRNIKPLRRKIKTEYFDLIHAHYGFSGLIASIANYRKLPIVISFMGEAELTPRSLDQHHDYNYLAQIWPFLNRYNAYHFCDAVVVKSKSMASFLTHKSNLFIIPNGVDMERFKPFTINQKPYKKKKHILWIGNKNRVVKGYSICKAILEKIENIPYELVCVNNIENERLPHFFNWADVLLFTSLSEGSPNVIKEAMACNTPILSTPVGDIPFLFKNTKGCVVSKSFDIDELSGLLIELLQKPRISNARERIKYLELDLNSTAEKIQKVYCNIRNNK